jgi:hypothetical protein
MRISGATGVNMPPEIQELVRFLSSEGFTEQAVRTGGMGGVYLQLKGEVREDGGAQVAWVEISGDRGALTILVKMTGMSEFIAPMVWRAKIDDIPVQKMSMPEQAEFVRYRLRDIAAAVRDDPSIQAELLRMGSDYMHKKYPWISKLE